MLQLALANGAYVVTAYAVTTLTARILEPADFGSFGVVMAWITVLTALLVKGLATTTAREMAAHADAPADAWQAGRVLGIRMSFTLALAGVLVSPLAARLFGATDLDLQFAIGSLAALTFGANAVLLAWPTGRRQYGRQAVAQVAYAIARLLLVVGGALVAGLAGAVVGYVLAPLLGALPLVMRHPKATHDVSRLYQRMIRAVVPISIVSIAVTAYFVVDIFALSSVVGGDDPQVGIYVAYGTLAHVPFFLLQAASVTIVPALAAASLGARAAALPSTMTDTVVLLAGPTLLLATAGDAAARVIFGEDYTAHEVVAPLALATAAVTIIANLVAVDVAIGRLRTALAITLGGVALVAVASWLGARADEGRAAANVAENVLAACVATLVLLMLHVRIRHGALFETGRTGAGVIIAMIAAVPPLLVDGDVVRMLVAGACGLGWLGAVIALRLVDVRRGSAVATDAEHA
jgi:O-antigen/teichoic acid export membrane protein